MKIAVKLIFFSLLVCGLTFDPVLADEVSLKNGDILTGEVMALEKDKLIFKTTYSGEIFIAWSEVEKISVNKPVGVLLKNGVSLSGVIETTEDGQIVIVKDKSQDRITVYPEEIEGINPLLAEIEKTKYTIRGNIGITIEDGNTNKEKVHLDGRLGARKRRHRFSVGFEYDYETNNDKKTKNKLLASTNLDYFFKYPWYLYGKGAYEFDEFKDLDLKLDLGPGLGYQFIESETANLSLEAGPSWVKQDFRKESRRDYIAGRVAIDTDKWFFDKLFQFFLFAEGFANPDREDDRFARLRTGIRIPIAWGFNLTTQYNLDYDNNPPEGIDDTDQRFLFLLGYNY